MDTIYNKMCYEYDKCLILACPAADGGVQRASGTTGLLCVEFMIHSWK